MGRDFNENTIPTIKEIVDQSDTFLIYDDSGSDDSAGSREKTRKNIEELANRLGYVKNVLYTYVLMRKSIMKTKR